jgi:hypothetical protein
VELWDNSLGMQYRDSGVLDCNFLLWYIGNSVLDCSSGEEIIPNSSLLNHGRCVWMDLWLLRMG